MPDRHNNSPDACPSVSMPIGWSPLPMIAPVVVESQAPAFLSAMVQRSCMLLQSGGGIRVVPVVVHAVGLARSDGSVRQGQVSKSRSWSGVARHAASVNSIEDAVTKLDDAVRESPLVYEFEVGAGAARQPGLATADYAGPDEQSALINQPRGERVRR